MLDLLMTRLIVLIIAMLFMDILLGLSEAVAESGQKTDAIPAEDYALYDQVVTSKFLTSATQLVVIERATQFRLSPDQEGPTTIGAFQEQEYFDGELPADLIREFTAINRQPSRLEGRFHFGVSYRFATGDKLEEPEVSLARPSHGWLARDRFKRRRCWIVWPSLAWHEAFATIMRCCMSKSYVPTAPEQDSSCGFAVKDEAGRCSIRKLRGPFRLSGRQKKGRCLRPDGLGL